MSHHVETAPNWNLWKFAAIGMGLLFATALVTGVVVANYVGRTSQPEAEHAAGAPVAPPARRANVEPSRADIDACNRYARSVSEGRAKETITDAFIGGALGAGLGAAGGAIAGGGSGAAKGAGIGALVGAAGGTLYGLNESNRSDARATQAYRACMRQHGYSD